MSSAETTHPIKWRDDGAGGLRAWVNGVEVARIYPEWGSWSAVVYIRRNEPERRGSGLPYSAARSFVEKSVKEASHGE